MGCRILPNIESRASQRTIGAGHGLEQLGGVLEQTDAHPAFARLTEADPRHQRHVQRARSLQQAQRAHAAEFEPRIGEIIAAWQNVGMTENAVNTAVTSTSSPAIPAETSAVSPATRAANRPLGTPLGKHPTRVLFLGAGELGKEVAIELMRLGAWVCAADSYAGAPAQQVAHEYRALDMANAAELQALFDEIKPDIIVPEVEAIATDVLAGTAAAGAQVVPSAEIAAICMDRERLRVLAHEELGLPTTPYRFAGSLEELRAGASEVGYPCVVKPVMSSSGHGQSVVRSADAIDAAWTEAQEGRRAADEGDVSRVIVEALAPLERELTVLTVSSSAGIVTCAPIGQRQESGDYRESWQPATEPGTDLRIFAKPEVHGHRRMAVALAVGESEADARAKAGLVADALTITVE